MPWADVTQANSSHSWIVAPWSSLLKVIVVMIDKILYTVHQAIFDWLIFDKKHVLVVNNELIITLYATPSNYKFLVSHFIDPKNACRWVVHYPL